MSTAVKRRKRWASGCFEPLPEDVEEFEERQRKREEERVRKEREREERRQAREQSATREQEEKELEEAKIKELAEEVERVEGKVEEGTKAKKEMFWLLKKVITAESMRKG